MVSLPSRATRQARRRGLRGGRANRQARGTGGGLKTVSSPVRLSLALTGSEAEATKSGATASVPNWIDNPRMVGATNGRPAPHQDLRTSGCDPETVIHNAVRIPTVLWLLNTYATAFDLPLSQGTDIRNFRLHGPWPSW